MDNFDKETFTRAAVGVDIESDLNNINNKLKDLFASVKQYMTEHNSNYADGAQISPILTKSALEWAEILYVNRKRRSSFFESEMFSEPAWDILLDLYISKCKGKVISVTSACGAADVPPTTALRWLCILEARGYASRQDDEIDKRRTYVYLTEKGFDLMTAYLGQCTGG